MPALMLLCNEVMQICMRVGCSVHAVGLTLQGALAGVCSAVRSVYRCCCVRAKGPGLRFAPSGLCSLG